MEHLYSSCSLESTLQLSCLSYFRNLNSFKVIAEFLEIFEKRFADTATMRRLIADSRKLLGSQDDLKEYML